MIKEMRHLKKSIHESIVDLDRQTSWKRLATRAICLEGPHILLLFTERYNDYSLPGGGLDDGEDIIEGMKRELIEETGAQNIRDIRPFGIYEEYRPWYKADFDVQHMISYCFRCKVDLELRSADLESYEVKNGMKALWVNIHEAITHNNETMKSCAKKGMSIERETFLLELIVNEMENLND